MNKIIFLILLVFFLATGVASGIAYERYVHREECLKLAFDNSNVENLSEEEISEILKTLNSENNDQGNTPPPTSAGYSSLEKNGSNPLSRGMPECSEGGVCKNNYVGSKNSDKFYPADCRYAKLIKEENKVFFNSQEEGGKAGRLYIECK